MFELLPFAIALGVGPIAARFKSNNDKEKILKFFKIVGVGVRLDKVIEYPQFKKMLADNYGTTYIFSVPLGIPGKIFEKFQDALGEGLGKPIKVSYDQYLLKIKVFKEDVPVNWNWTEDLVREGEWSVPIGKTLEEIMYHNFEKIQSMVIGGTAGYGKSVSLKVIMTSLILAQRENVEFYIIDLKEKIEFGRYEKLKQVKGIAGNPYEAFELLTKVCEDLRARLHYLRENHITNIVETNIKKRVFVIVDEAAELTPHGSKDMKLMLGECQHMLSEIARLGRACGFRLIFATQYPVGDALPRQIKQNSDAKLGFRLPTKVASEVVLDEGGLEELPSLPGRAIYKTDRCFTLQVPYISDKKMWELLKNDERNSLPNTGLSDETRIREENTHSNSIRIED